MRVLDARKAGQVKRYHQFRLLHEETVAEHSFNVVNLVLILTNGTASAALLVAAITHDMGEYVSGDIPAPVKRGLGIDAQAILEILENTGLSSIHHNLAPITTEETFTLKVADYLDGLLKCREEIRLGNMEMILVGEQYRKYLVELMARSSVHMHEIQHCIQLYGDVLQ